MQALALPDPSSAPGCFADATQPAERIERLVRDVFAVYERGAAELRAVRREAGVHPRVARDRDALEASLGALVDAALEPLDLRAQDRAVARAMLDLDVWQALRDQRLDPAACVAEVADMLTRRLVARP